ncbi:MAG TPA: hypothetical protein VJ440_02450 [Candidatus Brocadiaceae bacterium]|nr:hypothetical protein [Candidatus Brocadiaceae bacterium]
MNADKNTFDTIVTSPEPVKTILDIALARYAEKLVPSAWCPYKLLHPSDLKV